MSSLWRYVSSTWTILHEIIPYFFRECQLSYSKSHIAHSNEKSFSSESSIFSPGQKFYASYEIHISLPFFYERESRHYMTQTCTYYAILLHLYKISFHIILPSYIILPSRFYSVFLVKYWYAGLQIFSSIPYPSLLHTILIRNTSCWLQPIKIFFIILNAIPPSYSKIYQLLPYVALVMTNWLFWKHVDCSACGLP